jgi:mannobiose 2-epimerase
VYALAEYAAASGEEESRERAIGLQRLIENTAHDGTNGGYFETYERDWKLAKNQQLSEVDMDEKKSMNTHLHLLEAYANLLRLGNDEGLRERLKELLLIFLARVIDP